GDAWKAADVPEGGELPGGPAEEAPRLAQEPEVRRLAAADLARAERRGPVVAEAQLGDEVADVAAELGNGAVRGPGGHGVALGRQCTANRADTSCRPMTAPARRRTPAPSRSSRASPCSGPARARAGRSASGRR